MTGRGIKILASKNTKKTLKKIFYNYELYLFILPAFVYFIMFQYFPLYGVQIAFRNYNPGLGILNSPWVGLRHLKRFCNSYYFWVLIWNTLSINLYQLVAQFPAPIILALMINTVKYNRFKRIVQSVTYAPHFISTMVFVGMIFAFLSPASGLINNFIRLFGGREIPFITRPELFKSIYVWTGVWKSMGWGSIIYLAALTGISVEVHEAAIIDGATRLKRVWYVDIPGILPTIVILLILNIGRIMSVGFERIFLMQNPLNMSSSDVINTYVYRTGMIQAQYSFSAAVGLFNSLINFIMLILANRISRKVAEISLW